MEPLNLPKDWPSLTPAGYYVVQVSPGYSYKRKVGTKLVRRKGKKKRVRVNVYRKIVVEELKRLVWVVQFPATRERWFNVGDYQEGIEAQKAIEGYEVTERDMEIFHSSPASDVIHGVEEIRNGKSVGFGEPTLFVWRAKKLPTKLKVFKRERPFRMVRIWFWVYHNEKEEYRVWCRSSTIYESNFKEAWEFALKFYETVADDLGKAYDYLEVHGLVAWTAYTLGERARRRDPRAVKKESGGSQ